MRIRGLQRIVPSPAMGVALVAVVVALGGTSYAAVSAASSSSVLRGCVGKQSGVLHVVSAGMPCHKGQFAISWNAAGRPGKQGTAGAAGSAGATGPAGATGRTGSTGSTGAAGTARAYGSVPASCAALTTCTLTVGQNATVTHPFIGIYCISVPGATPANSGAVATLENNDGNHIAYLPGGSSCAQTLEIQIVNPGMTMNVDDAFFFAVP